MRSIPGLSVLLLAFALMSLHACGDTEVTPNPTDTTTPPGDTTTPPGDTTTPPGDTTTPPGDTTTPPGDETTPPADETTPPGDETTPPVDETTPPVDAVVGPCGGECASHLYCVAETGNCGLLIVGGEPCETDGSCHQGACNANGTCACNSDDPSSCQHPAQEYCDSFSVCAEKQNAGSPCAEAYECDNNNCTASGGCGCVDGDCASNKYCDASALCAAKKNADEACTDGKECMSDTCNDGKCGCNNDVSCPNVHICDGGSCKLPGTQASGVCSPCAADQYCVSQYDIWTALGLQLCNDKRQAGEDCAYNGLCTSGICDKSGEGQEIEVDLGFTTITIEIGVCGCLLDSDCPASNNCNEDTNQCAAVVAQNECTSCDPSIEGICGQNTCYTTGTTSACVDLKSKSYGDTCCKTVQCKSTMKCVNHGSGKKCYRGYGNACNFASQPENDGYCFLDIGIVDEGDGATVCFPFVKRCNPSPCIPGAGLCGLNSCNPIGTLEILYGSWVLPFAANIAQDFLDWEEGDVIDIGEDFVTGDPVVDTLINQFVDGYACINPGTIPQGKFCIGTNHCQEGLTCKGIPFESKCLP
jgi:hypothetical protein